MKHRCKMKVRSCIQISQKIYKTYSDFSDPTTPQSYYFTNLSHHKKVYGILKHLEKDEFLLQMLKLPASSTEYFFMYLTLANQQSSFLL